MQPLIDGDILCYEIGSVGQYISEETGQVEYRSWDWVASTLDQKIKDICEAVEASQKPIVYLTGDTLLWKMLGRLRGSLEPYSPNFRIAKAVSKDYKGGRKPEKPYHYNNIRAYLISEYEAFVANGCEADDEMAMEQTKRFDPSHLNDYSSAQTIICTRDKDLRQVPGWHYGWECGRQGEFGPTAYDKLGTIVIDRTKKPPKIVGGGFAFFCSQLITGDPVDNIGGLQGYGPAKVDGILGVCTTPEELLSSVRKEYELVYGEAWKTQLREQCDLLWMIRGRNEDGSLKYFNPKEDVDG